MKHWLQKYNKDHFGGALMFLLGLGAAWAGVGYKVGTLSRMGPGFFPTALGAILMLIGIKLISGAAKAPRKTGGDQLIWRGPVCICLSLVAFIALGRYGGLVPATFAVVFISALGDRKNTVRQAALLAVAVVALAVGIFWWALRMQFPLFQWG